MEIAVWITDPEIECWSFADRHARRIREALPGAAVTICASEAEFLRALPRARVACVWVFEEEWLAAAPRLEWIATPAAGRDILHVRPRPGLEITYGEFHGEIMAETVLAFLLAHRRGILETRRLQDAAPWPRADLQYCLRPLRGSRLTILGFGSIGRWIGRLAKPFGVRVTGVKRCPAPRPDEFEPEDRIALAGELDSILPETDFLAVCLPRSEETDRIVDARRLALLPEGAVVVNVGRGNAIDEAALARRLAERRLGGAYLDVYENEPLPEDSPLRSCPNVLLMPHASAISPNYLDLFVEEFIRRCRERSIERP